MTDPCLSETSILALVQGSLLASARDEAEKHLAECEECRVLVSVLARSSVLDGASGNYPIVPPLRSQGSSPPLELMTPVAPADLVDPEDVAETLHPPAPAATPRSPDLVGLDESAAPEPIPSGLRMARPRARTKTALGVALGVLIAALLGVGVALLAHPSGPQASPPRHVAEAPGAARR